MLNKFFQTTQRNALPLPAINESFPQFSRPAISLLASPPLDLSLRAPNIITITPPSTPSPPRKRSRLMSDEYGGMFWRPHALPAGTPAATTATTTATVSGLEPTAVTAGANPVNATTLSGNYVTGVLGYEGSVGGGGSGGSKVYRGGNFVEIPARQLGMQTAAVELLRNYPTICVDDDEDEDGEDADAEIEEDNEMEADVDEDDDETIILTEDEDDTVVSSHGYTTATEHTNDEELGLATGNQKSVDGNKKTDESERIVESSEEDEYVDVLSNDDDDLNALSANAMLRNLQNQVYEAELERSGKVLTRNKRIYDDVALHNQAVDGLAKLFEQNFDGATQTKISTADSPQQKSYIDLSLSGDEHLIELSLASVQQSSSPQVPTSLPPLPMPALPTQSELSELPIVLRSSQTRPPKNERKRTKLRKNLNIDEETISPVSGTIIRKLREDEQLVVRKGDIDPAFNVVEITEEAKAILASIDNKIGAYLCQLCRTVYDDAFMLAQHRCPRIVHIEYKCSECEKVFNCPANLASHRRWHKPKSELIASGGGQQKKRHSQPEENSPDKGDDCADGVFPCTQCGKTFRRQAYLKKHQISHQMLENLKTLELFKNNSNNFAAVQSTGANQQPTATTTRPTPLNAATAAAVAYHTYPHVSSNATSTVTSETAKTGYAPNHRISAAFPFVSASHFDQRRFYTLSEFYLSQQQQQHHQHQQQQQHQQHQQQQQQQQQLERNSAFQYVQANHLHLRQLNSVPGGFLPKVPVATQLAMPLPVK